MLAYLEELCSALLAHDSVAVQRLLGSPLARSLPRQVREEALALSRANPSSLRAPIQVLRFYHQTLQLREPSAEVSEMNPAAEADVAESITRVMSERTDRAVASLVTETTHAPTCDECLDQIELPLEVAHRTKAVAA